MSLIFEGQVEVDIVDEHFYHHGTGLMIMEERTELKQ